VTLQLHDTMSRELVAVEPIEPGHVRLYTCGPTVWNRVHIGNFRTFIFEDVLRRWLDRRFNNNVTHVMNLTDVDDRIIKNAVEHGTTLEAETAPWIAAFEEDRDTLGIRPAHFYPRATQYIDQMVDLIERLVTAGTAYESDGSYYFHIAAFPAYGRLSGASAEGLVSGASGRIDADDYTKEDVRDFALWKAVGPDEIGWDTRIGRGHPGWHIECSAMSMTLLGESFDIHCGGVDNIFPHHENEIAQSEGATGKPFVRIWCHSQHLRVSGEKMAKRLGNFSTVNQVLEEGASAASLRYLLAARTHYRKQLDYSDELLADSNAAVQRLVDFQARVAELHTVESDDSDRDHAVLASVRGMRIGFEEAMDDDLNLPEAMGIVFSGLRDVNRLLDSGPVASATQRTLQHLLEEIDSVLGVLALVSRDRMAPPDAEEQRWLNERAAARAARDFGQSDHLRSQLAARGIEVEDTPQGQRWKRISPRHS
jgi:cysteinyl-tRNA synthetase